VIIDAILGTGASGELRGPAADAVSAINQRATAARVIAVDIPTGVDASTGAVAHDAVTADLTIALHAPKVGHYVAPGTFHCGEIRVADIGIPAEAAAGAGVTAPAAGTIGPRVLRLIPRRDDLSSKFSSGALAVLGGSTGLTGATCLAAMAAQRAGAGYVTALVPRSLNAVFELRLLEVMTQPLPDADGAIEAEGLDAVVQRSERSDAMVAGPGIGRADGTIELIREVASRVEAPLLIDADGLFAFSGQIETLRSDGPRVITPHSGELARLLDVSSDEVSAGRLQMAVEAANRSGAVVVLKGADSIIAAPGQIPLVNTLRAPGLATAGTGDVLAGIIGAYLAKGLGAREAAAAGVVAHALAGREAGERRGPDHMIASDVIEALPSVLA
jgi:NAD(P)H-hydrate epimerase